MLVTQSVKLFFLFFFFQSQTKKPSTGESSFATHKVKLRGDREKALGARISGDSFRSVNYDWSMATQRRPLTKNCLYWLLTRPRIFFAPTACVMPSPGVISKIKYFGFGFTTPNCSTCNSKIKSTKGKIKLVMLY